MKKIILSAIALSGFMFSNAQEAATTEGGGFSAGDVFISGSVGFRSEKTGDNKVNGFNIIPRAAYFISDNLAIGAQVAYTTSKSESSTPVSNTEIKTDVFAIGAFGRYYFTPTSRFSFFGQFGFNYLTANQENELTETILGDTTTTTTENQVNGFNIGLAPGVSYFLSDNIAIEATFGVLDYTTTEPDAEGAESTDVFNIGLNLEDINFGIIYKF